MKIAVLADAHGNQFGFAAALDDARRNQADLIVSAGDMLASFPGGPEILRTLVSDQILTVLGNADELLLKWWRSEPTSQLRTSPQFRPLQTSCARFTDADFAEIESWPLTQLFTAEGRSVLLCHGTPKSNMRSIADSSWSPITDGLTQGAPDAIIAGHQHHHWSDISNDIQLVLAGSCGMPCGGDTNAQYTILDVTTDSVRVQHQTVAYDRDKFLADLKVHDYVRQASPIGWLELSQIVTARPLMLYYFRDRFDPARGPDLEFLAWSVREYLEECGVLVGIETVFGPLVTE